MTRPSRVIAALMLVCATLPAFSQTPAPPLCFHAAFEGTVEAVAAGNPTPLQTEGPVKYRPGRLGQALLCGEGGALLHYATEGNLHRTGGTVEMWVCPLDWTGDEDEFHVFLEARDPGWLVFYRYYQGGILTLLGTGEGSGSYRSAGGPRIEWVPGEWHHIAGTWRKSGLEVYVDGERTGFCPNPLIPADLAGTFRIGDHPWHVARTRQTLIDEVKLYSTPLDAESIARAARGEPIDFRPQLALQLDPDPDTETLQLSADAAGLLGSFGGRRVRIELRSEGGAEPIAAAEIDAFTDDVGVAELPLAGVAEGEYQVRGVLVGADGAAIAETSTRFVKPGPSVWSGNTLGMEDKVLPPWTALKVDRQAASVECWGRTHAFGTLLDTVSSQGTPMLSSPVALEAVIAGKTVTLRGERCAVDAASDTKATLSSNAAAGGLKLAARHDVEFDGYTWTDLSIEPDAPMTVEELRLTWSMPRAEATLMHADCLNWARNEAGALGADGWSSPHTHFFWLGNEQRGLSWYTESDQHWVASEDRPALEARPEGDHVKVTIRLIAEPTEITSKLTYGFGMMATPVKPKPENARRWRMAPGVRPTFRIIWPNGNMKYYGHTEPIDPEKFRQTILDSHAKGCLVVPYVNLNFVSAGVPEWGYYGKRWSDRARAVTPSDVAQMGHASMGVCPSIRDWQDYILYRINEMIDTYEVDGIYIDCWGPYPCTAGTCGWQDEKGKMHPTRPIRAYREILRRVYTLFYEKRPDPLLMVHMSSQVNIPMLSFNHTLLDGEQFRSVPLEDDYLHFMPPEMVRAEFMGHNYGLVDFFLPEFRGEYGKTGTATLAAYLMLHDITAWPIWSDIEQWNRLYEAADAFGLERAEFRPYWAGEASAGPLLASTYTNDGAAMIAAVYAGESPRVSIEFDLEAMGLPAVRAARDAIRGDKFEIRGNRLQVPFERHQGRVIWVNPND